MGEEEEGVLEEEERGGAVGGVHAQTLTGYEGGFRWVDGVGL